MLRVLGRVGHHVACIGIILAEGAFAALAITGGLLLFLRRNDAAAFSRGQPSSWNGKDTVTNISMLWGVFAVLLAMNEPLGTTADAECGIGAPRQRPGEKSYEAESVESESISCPPRASCEAMASFEPALSFLPTRPTVRATVPALRETTPATPVMAEPA